MAPSSEEFDYQAARSALKSEEVAAAVEKAVLLAATAEPSQAARELGTSGYVIHTIGFATYCLARFGTDPAKALDVAVNAGGDTDSIGAIVGALLGARHGASALPAALLCALEDGPMGRSHLEQLADALVEKRSGPPRFRFLQLLARNLLLFPVIFGHGLRRIVWRIWR